jgi:hypothetical protein
MEDPVCFITTGDPQDLVKLMVERLHRIADAAYAILKDQFADVYTQLRALADYGNEHVETGDDAGVDSTLTGKLDAYLRQLPVIGFHSGNMI